MSEERPVSRLAEKVMADVDEIDRKMHHLSDKAIKGLHFFLKEVLKLVDYIMFIDYDKPEIVIQPRAQGGENIPTTSLDTEACSKMFLWLPQKLGIPDYIIRFINENDSFVVKPLSAEKTSEDKGN